MIWLCIPQIPRPIYFASLPPFSAIFLKCVCGVAFITFGFLSCTQNPFRKAAPMGNKNYFERLVSLNVLSFSFSELLQQNDIKHMDVRSAPIHFSLYCIRAPSDQCSTHYLWICQALFRAQVSYSISIQDSFSPLFITTTWYIALSRQNSVHGANVKKVSSTIPLAYSLCGYRFPS